MTLPIVGGIVLHRLRSPSERGIRFLIQRLSRQCVSGAFQVEAFPRVGGMGSSPLPAGAAVEAANSIDERAVFGRVAVVTPNPEKPG
jgi:hypothetical protein